MSQTLLFQHTHSKSRLAAPIRRRLRLIEILPGRVFSFEIYSMTRAGYDIEHRQDADLQTGALRCSCEDFVYRQARFFPSVGDPTHICKHLGRALDYLVRQKHLHGHEVAVYQLMKQLRPCCDCGCDMADYELCDERGFALDGFICRACVERKRVAAHRLEDMRCRRLDREARWIRQGERELQNLTARRQAALSDAAAGPSWNCGRETVLELFQGDLEVLRRQHSHNLQRWGSQAAVSA